MFILTFATTLTIFLFDRALKVVDEALLSAARAKKKTSEKVDQAFKAAIEVLESYDTNYHRDRQRTTQRTVNERMAEAKENDKTFSTTIWESLTNWLSPKVRLGRIQLLHLT
jgi:hypothetical protein